MPRAHEQAVSSRRERYASPAGHAYQAIPERQWFKSRVGMDATETPRDISFCEHVVEADAGLVVPDTYADARFANNPLVAEAPRIRFYAGMPLRTQAGHVLGTLCAIDSRPRALTVQETATLQCWQTKR
jgi:GAF domain-containing protein